MKKSGTIKYYNPNKGIGCISSGSRHDIFFRITDCHSHNLPEPGQKVSFVPQKINNRILARKIEPLETKDQNNSDFMISISAAQSSDPMRQHDTQSKFESGEKKLLYIVYVLYLLGTLNGITVLIGFIISLMKKGSSPHPLVNKHYSNQVGIFLWLVIWLLGISISFFAFMFLGAKAIYPISDPFTILGTGMAFIGGFNIIVFIVTICLLLWFLYRNIAGLITLASNKGP